MKKLLAFCLILVPVIAVAVDYTRSDRIKGSTEFIKTLNGSPVHVVSVSTDGGITANTCTSPAGAGDAGHGDFLLIQCKSDHYVKVGNCATTATSSDLLLADGEKFYTLLQYNQNAFAALPNDAGVIGGCRGYRLR